MKDIFGEEMELIKKFFCNSNNRYFGSMEMSDFKI